MQPANFKRCDLKMHLSWLLTRVNSGVGEFPKIRCFYVTSLSRFPVVLLFLFKLSLGCVATNHSLVWTPCIFLTALHKNVLHCRRELRNRHVMAHWATKVDVPVNSRLSVPFPGKAVKLINTLFEPETFKRRGRRSILVIRLLHACLE